MTLFVVIFEFRGGKDPSITIVTDTENREAALSHASGWMAKNRPGFGIEHAHVYRVEKDISRSAEERR